jgi:hypothetical protein
VNDNANGVVKTNQKQTKLREASCKTAVDTFVTVTELFSVMNGKVATNDWVETREAASQIQSVCLSITNQ